jgi:Fe-S-cluster-containing dehydrogenase component
MTQCPVGKANNLTIKYDLCYDQVIFGQQSVYVGSCMADAIRFGEVGGNPRPAF